MIKLRVLGGISLHSADGGELRSITAQPKRIALLAYLAIATRGSSVRRDTVLGLFWPELDAERARHALRQSLYHLRRELGADLLRGNGDDELRIDPALLACDAVEFRAAVAARAHERALECYQGELLPGLYISGAPEFEQWLAMERTELQQQAIAAATALCDRAGLAGRKSEVVHWAQVAQKLAPFDESVVRRLILAFIDASDPAGAVMAFDAFAERLERELDVAPTQETRALIEGLRSNARIVARPRRSRTASLDLDAPALTKSRWRDAPLLTTGAMIMLVAIALLGALGRRNAVPMDPTAIAILPFRVLGPSSDSATLADGIPALLALDVEAAHGPRVIDARAVAARWREALRAGGGDAPDVGRDIARSVGAGLLLEGTAMSRGSTTVLTASLLDVRTGEVRAKAALEGPAAQLVQNVDRLGARVLADILHEDPLRLERLTGTSIQAIQSYLQGKAAARRGEYEVSYQFLSRALQIDSTFALAALSLAEVAQWSGRVAPNNYLRIAYVHRDRLASNDAAYLQALIGSRDTLSRTSSGEMLRLNIDVARQLSDRPEMHYLLGDRYYHAGDLLGFTDASRRSLASMERALKIDPGFAPAREHLIELAALLADPKLMQRYRALMLETESGPRMPYLRWLAAQVLADPAERRLMRAALDTMPSVSLSNILLMAQEAAVGLDDAQHAADVLVARATNNEDAGRWGARREVLYYNLGRIAQHDSLYPYPPVTPQTQLGDLIRIIHTAMFREVAPEATRAAAAELERRVADLEVKDDAARAQQLRMLHFLEMWKLLQGDTSTAGRSLAIIRNTRLTTDDDGPPRLAAAKNLVRATTIEAMLEHVRLRQQRSKPRPALLHLDSLAREAVAPELIGGVNLVLMRLFREDGDYVRGLAASRRRLRSLPNFLAVQLREEARFADALGDRAGAIRACEMYLALRAKPDPVLMPQADSVRTICRRLKGA